MASVCCLDINGRYVALGSDDGIIAIYDAEK